MVPARGGHRISAKGGRNLLGRKLFQKFGTNLKKKGTNLKKKGTKLKKDEQHSRKKNKTQEQSTKLTKLQAQGAVASPPPLAWSFVIFVPFFEFFSFFLSVVHLS